MRGLLIGVLVVAVLAILAFLLVANNRSATREETTSQQTNEDRTTEGTNNGTVNPPPASNNETNSETAANNVTITYTNSGFSPATVTIKSGGTVTVKNDSTRMIQFNSDPHPSHTENSELNLGEVGGGSSKSFTATKTGSWGYHDHLNSSDRGTIVVQ
jgi:plastocyanin